MIEGAVVLFVAAGVLAILGISFVVDIGKNIGPVGQLASVDSVDSSRTYTFMRVKGKGVAIFITVLTFLLSAGALVGAIVMLAMKHH
jgi:hypothetical protein